MTHLNSKNVMIKALIDQKKDLILKNKAPNEPDILVYDGIVDEVCFGKQKKKVLFLLKDGNDPNRYEDGNGYTYRDLYETAITTTENETPKTRLYTMWRYMCMWMGIIEDPNFSLEQCWTKESGFDVDRMRGYLLHIATVNIKKSAGKGTNDETYDPALKRAVKNYYDLIKDEIALIKPDLVICGDTFTYVKDQYGVEPETLPNGRRYFSFEDCVYLEYWHPSARFGYEKHFNRFKETYTYLCDRLSLGS